MRFSNLTSDKRPTIKEERRFSYSISDKRPKIEEEKEERRFTNSTTDKRPLEVMRASDRTIKQQQSKSNES